MSAHRSADERTHRPPVGARFPAARLAVVLLAALLALTLALAPRAEAFVYWPVDFSIGRANPDGTGVNYNFLELPPVREDPHFQYLEGAYGVAVDAAHVYWISGPRGGIGRANLNGKHVRQGFIRVGIPVGELPCDLEVDAARIYWTDSGTDPVTIGRANLDGTGADRSFITGAASCGRVAVDESHIYWTSLHEGTGTIARANLDGTGVNHGFLIPPGEVCGVAVDASHVYWSGLPGLGGIGRANLDGTNADPSFIPSGDVSACDLAVDRGHIYWVEGFSGGAIGRANLDGSGVDRGFIPAGTEFIGDLAVDPLRSFSFGKVKTNKKRGTAKLTVNIPEAGNLKLANTEKVRGARQLARAAGKVRLSIRPRGRAKEKLREIGRAKVGARVTYTPVSGDPNIVPSTDTQPLKLVKRR